MVVVVVAVVACAGALIGGFVAWRVPDFDPAAPRVGGHTIAGEVEEHPRTASFLNSRLNPSTATGLALTVALAIAVLGAIAIGSLLARYKRIRPAAPEAPLTYKGSFFLRGLASLPVEVS
jgi:hypothetical protein